MNETQTPFSDARNVLLDTALALSGEELEEGFGGEGSYIHSVRYDQAERVLILTLAYDVDDDEEKPPRFERWRMYVERQL